MDFECKTTIHFYEEDFDEIIRLCKNGMSFHDAYRMAIAGWDDDCYYLACDIEDKVEDYVRKTYNI